MKWKTSTPRCLMLLAAILLVSTAAATTPTPNAPTPEPEPSGLPPPPPPATTSLDRIHQQTTLESAQWVSEARALLRSLEPAPQTPAGTSFYSYSSTAGSILQTLWFYFKQFLLWHNAESLEETVKVGVEVGGNLDKAVELLQRAAEARDDDASFLLAEMNFYGNWTHPRSYPEAFRRYKQLADDTGNSTAQHMVGFMYATGIGGAVEKDQGKALLYHTFAALGGNIRSEMTIAFRHHQGIGMPRNCEESVYFYQRAAEKAVSWWESGPPGGHYLPRNAYRLADDMGGVYGEGASAVSAGPNAHRNRQSYETAKDVEEYMEYMELFARKGAVPETVILAKRYYDGHRNVPRDVVRAKEYFLRVARQYWDRDGKVKPDDQLYMEKFAGTAAGYLGVMALRGEPGPQDYAIAQMWFNRGNTAGDANSQNWLGYMYLNGLGVKQDRKRARTYFQAAMLQDWPTAQVNYAKMLLESGEFTEAKRYMESAGRHGNIEAIYYLAVIINSAAPKDRSCTLATIYYKMVVERIEPPQSPIAWANEAYENGDLESALIGYMMAAEQGYESAQANVAYLLDDKQPALSLRELVYPTTTPPTTPEQANKTRIEKELALIYWTRSAKQSNIDSLVKMGDYYLSGIGTEMDPAKAASCYSAAAEHQASAQALWNLGWMHENGVGVSQDFHLAKRYYDLSFESNPEAYLPVTLSLFKLRARAFWNAITHGGIKGIGPDPAKKKVTFREFLRRWYEATARADAVRVQEDELAAANAVREQQLADEFGYVDEELDGDFLESVVILGIAGALAAAIYYRQWRQRRRDEEGRAAAAAAVAAGGQQQQQPLPPLGIWNDPGMPGWGMPH